MKKPLLKRLTSASAAVMMLFMQLLTLPAEQLIPAVAEEIVTSDRGALIASNYRLLKDGKDIKDGVEVAQGDELTLAFDWRINNNEDYTVYEATIDLIDISFAEKSGQIYEEGEAIADFIIEPTDDGKFKFVAHFDTEKTANKSNIGGGAIMDASVDADAERKLPDRSEIKLAFGDKLANAVYRNPGSVDGVKTAGKLRDGGDGTYYIDYSLSFKLRDIMESPVISDDLDDSTELDMSSLKLSLNGNDVTADPAYTITKSSDGFTIELPKHDNKLSEDTYTVEYSAALIENKSPIENKASLNYTDDQGEPQKLEKSAKTTITAPSSSKSGQYLSTQTDGKYYPIKKMITKNDTTLNLYPVIWTVDIKAGSYGISSPSSVTLEDVLGDTVLDYFDPEWLYYSTAGPHRVALYYAFSTGDAMRFLDSVSRTDTNTSASIDDIKLYSNENKSGSALSKSELMSAIENTAALVRVDKKGNPVAPLLEGTATLDDMNYTENNGVYTFKYITFVPSTQTTNITSENHFSAELGGNNVSADGKTSIDTSPDRILVKGANGLQPSKDNYVDNPSNTSNQKRYELGIDTVDDSDSPHAANYWVAVNLDELRYNYVGDTRGAQKQGWDTSDALKNTKNIVIEDYLGGIYFIPSSDPSQTIRESSGSAGKTNKIDLSTVKLGIYRTNNGAQFSGFSGPEYDAYIAAEKALLNYYETYGSINDPKAGFVQSELIELWSTYNTALNKFKSVSGYIGELSYEDMLTAGIDVNVNGNKLSVDIPVGSSIFFKSYSYTPMSDQPNATGGGSYQNLSSFIGNSYNFVLSYTAPLREDLIPGESTTIFNAAKVKFDKDNDPSNDPYPPSFVNSTLTMQNEKPDEPKDEISVTKTALNSSFSFFDDSESFYGATKRSWRINVDMSKAAADKEIVLNDTLPEGLIFDQGVGVKAVFTSNASGSLNSSNCAAIDSGLYDVSTSDGKVVISFTNSEAFAAARNSKKYASFIITTDIRGSKFFTNGGSESFTNTVIPTYGGTEMPKTSATTSVKYDNFLNKVATDATYDIVTNEPVENENHDNKINAYYRIELNPSAAQVNGGKAYTVTDTMTDCMKLDKSSVTVTDADTLEVLDAKFSVNGNQVLFTVLDGRHILIKYKIELDVNPIRDLQWTSVQKSQNSVSVNVTGNNETVSDSIDFSEYEIKMTVWAYKMDGEITVHKYAVENNSEKDLTGAEFELYTVYDNNNRLYDDQSGYMKSCIIEEDDGEYTFSGLPLDRVYKLVETKAPKGYSISGDGVSYFVLQGSFNVDIDAAKEALGLSDIKVYNDGDTVDVINHKIDDIKISKQNVNNQALNGAQLTLYRLDGSNRIEVDSWISSDTDVHVIAGSDNTALRIDASYILVEDTAPLGYQKANEITFRIESDGSVSNVEGGEFRDGVIVMFDDILFVEISKRNVGNEELAGASLTLRADTQDIDLSGVTALRNGEEIDIELNEEKNEITFVSGEFGTILNIIPAGDYTLTETAAPDGYTLTEDVSFTVNEDGTVLINGEASADHVVILEDKLTTVSISKRAVGSESELDGAVFTLTGNANWDTVLKSFDENDDHAVQAVENGISWKTTDNELVIKGLTVGELYVLEETEAPDGYDYSESITIKLDNGENGATVVLIMDPETGEFIEVDRIIMFDELIEEDDSSDESSQTDSDSSDESSQTDSDSSEESSETDLDSSSTASSSGANAKSDNSPVNIPNNSGVPATGRRAGANLAAAAIIGAFILTYRKKDK